MDKTTEEMIEISKQNPKEIYTSDQGLIIHNGLVFNDKETFEQTIKLTLKTHQLFKKLKSFFFFWK